MSRLTQEQLAARRGGMGSTDVVEVCGLAPWHGAGPMRVYCEKRSIFANEPAEPGDARAMAMEWGHVQEPVIARWYEAQTGQTLFPCGTTWSRRAGEEWLFCTHDYAIHGQGIRKGVEIKHRNGFMALREGWNTDDPNGVPDSVRAQVTIQMRVCEYDEVDVCASINGEPPRVWTVKYDYRFADMLVLESGQFWTEHVVAGVPPEVDGTPASRAYLLATYPREEDPLILDATEDMTAIAVERMRWANDEKIASSRKRTEDNRLLSGVASHSGIRGVIRSVNWKMSWKTGADGVRRSRFTSRSTEDE
jgi:predicted phage-related endonuclease